MPRHNKIAHFDSETEENKHAKSDNDMNSHRHSDISSIIDKDEVIRRESMIPSSRPQSSLSHMNSAVETKLPPRTSDLDGSINQEEYEIYYKNTKAYKTIEPPVRIMKYLGCYVRDKHVHKHGRKLCLQYIRLFITAFLMGVAIFAGVRMIMQLDLTNGLKLTSTNIVLFIFIMFVIQIVLIPLFITYWFWQGKVRSFVLLVHEVSGGEGCIVYKHSFTVLLNRCWTMLMVIVILFTGATFIYVRFVFLKKISDTISSVCDHIFHNNDHSLSGFHLFWIPELDFLTLMFVTWGWCLWLAAMVFYTRLCECAAVEFKFYNKTLKRHHRDGILRDRGLLARHFKAHIAFSRICFELSDMIQYMLLCLLCLNVTTLIVCSFAVLSKQLTWYELVIGWTFMGVNLMQLFTLTMLPALVYEQANRAHDIIHDDIDIWYPPDPKIYEIAQAFSYRLTTVTVGISIGGFMTITRSFIFTVISLIITYVLLLWEFDSPDNVDACAYLSNITDILSSNNYTFH